MKRFFLFYATLVGTLGIHTGCTQDLKWSAVDRMIARAFPEALQITTDSLALLLAAPSMRKPLLLDTRPEAEYAVSHLQGALRIDPDTEDFAFLDTLARDAPIVAYCSVGYRSSQIVQRLQEAGFTNASNLKGSIFQWANEGRPIYRDDAPIHQVHPYDKIWGSLLDKPLRAYTPTPEKQ